MGKTHAKTLRRKIEHGCDGLALIKKRQPPIDADLRLGLRIILMNADKKKKILG